MVADCISHVEHAVVDGHAPRLLHLVAPDADARDGPHVVAGTVEHDHAAIRIGDVDVAIGVEGDALGVGQVRRCETALVVRGHLRTGHHRQQKPDHQEQHRDKNEHGPLHGSPFQSAQTGTGPMRSGTRPREALDIARRGPGDLTDRRPRPELTRTSCPCEDAIRLPHRAPHPNRGISPAPSAWRAGWASAGRGQAVPSSPTSRARATASVRVCTSSLR